MEADRSIEDSEEGQWYLIEIDEDRWQATAFVMLTPGDRLTTSYQCSVVADGGKGSGPTVNIRYPEDMLKNLAGEEEMVTVETVVTEEVLPVEWKGSYPYDTGISLFEDDAKLLVRRIGETDAENYRLIFPDHPELDRTVPSVGLGEIAGEVIAECEVWDGASAARELRPPQVVQDPADGEYTYTASDGRFTLRYPADCGQMWEAPGLANNTDRCSGGGSAITTWVEWNDMSVTELADHSPEWLAGTFADRVAAGAAADGALVSRDTLKTAAGHVLETFELKWEIEEGGMVTQGAVFVDADLWLIAVYMNYPADEVHLYRERVIGAFKTFTAREPAK